MLEVTSIPLNLLIAVLGIAILVFGADKFVAGAAAIARHANFSPLLIGLTIVALGTSAPEIMVSVIAAASGNLGLSVGNALGSNITNIALVLGVTAMIAPLTVRTQLLRAELPLLVIVSLLAAATFLDLQLTRLEGVLLLAGQVLVMGWLIRLALQRRANEDPLAEDFAEEIPDDWPLSKAVFWFLLGLVLLLLGARGLVWSAVNIATVMGVSDLVIGLTIVAIGTSLPELAASVMAVKKGEHDLAVGNVIGSNLFNLLVVMGAAACVGPGPLEPAVLWRDAPLMLLLTGLLFLMSLGWRGQGRISRIDATGLLAIFVAFQLVLYFGVGS